MVQEGYRGGMKKYDFSLTSVGRSIILVLLPLTAYSLGLVPSLLSFFYLLPFFSFINPLHIILFAFFLVVEFFIFMIFETLVPGLFLKIFRIRCEEGLFDVSIKDKTFFKLALHNMLYRPPLKLIEQFKLFPLRRLHLKLAGLKIDNTSILPGTELFYDPYVTEIGKNTLFGGYVKVTGHMIEDKMRIKKVKIGNNCMIGAETYIMAGAVIEDDVTVGIRSVITKNQVLKKGKTYVGIPAREIKSK
jgi:hypothetical protein